MLQLRKGLEMLKRNSERVGVGILAALLAMIILVGVIQPSYAQSFNYSIGWATTGKLLFSDTAPTVASGFGTSPSISASNGGTVVLVNVGTGGTATADVLTMPAASTGWNCQVNNITAAAAHVAYNTRQITSSTTTVGIENQTTSTGAAVAWGASDIVRMICAAY